MIIQINKFLSSNQISLKINENFEIDDGDFLSNTHLHKDIKFSGNVFKIGESVFLNGTIEYIVQDECGRCLTPFDNTVETKFEAVLVKQVSDDESDEIQIKVTVEGCVDLEDTIKQLIYLSMPMKSVCKKDCKGICPNCGANLNEDECKCNNIVTDPRFDKLKDLL